MYLYSNFSHVDYKDSNLVLTYNKMVCDTPPHQEQNQRWTNQLESVALASCAVDRVIRKLMLTYLETNEVLLSRQQGFRTRCSTLTILI